MDETDRRVREQALNGAARAYGYRAGTPESREPACTCTHGLSAHHGPDGLGRCGEGCPCDAFTHDTTEEDE